MRARRHPAWTTFAVLVVVLLALGGWLGIRAVAARRHLLAAQSAILDVKAQLGEPDRPGVGASFDDAAAHAAAARRLTGDPVWEAASHLPLAGDAFQTGRTIARSVDLVLRGPLHTLLSSRDTLDPAALRRDDGSIDLAVLASPQLALASALDGLRQIERDVNERPEHTRLSAVDDARSDLLDQLAELRRVVGHAEAATRVGPAMLGGDGVRRYFVAFQNTAESRGTGGLVGAYGILEADRGRLRMARIGSNADLSVTFREPVLRLDPEFESFYRGPYAATTMWGNANLSPHFPYAAQIWLAMWQRQFGERLDGVIATDPQMLSHLLGATGPVTLPTGETVTAANVVELTERTAYVRFDADNPGRKDFLVLIARAVADEVLHKAGGSPAALGTALSDGASDGRLRIWSRFPDEARAMADTAISGALPDRDGPLAALVVNNAGANKLDYYLDRKVDYRLGMCLSDGRRRSRVTVTLTNVLPEAELPNYVSGAAYDPDEAGINKLVVSLFAPRGARLEIAQTDGLRTTMIPFAERGRPVYTSTVRLLPRKPVTIVYDLLEPISEAAPVVVEQPLVRAQRTTVVDRRCSPVASVR